MIKIGELLFATTLFVSVFAKAAPPSVLATVDHDEIGLGDSVTITVSVSSSDSIQVEEPRVPQLDGFDLVNSWTASSTSSKLMQTSRGMEYESIRRQEFNFMLSPKRLGRLGIPAFEVLVEGKAYYTQPIVVTVSSQAQQQQQPQAVPDEEMDEAEQLFNQLLQRRGLNPRGGGHPTKPINSKESFFIQLDVDKTEVFEGEQITASWYLYTRGNILSLERNKFPDLKGFWKEIIEEVPALNFTQEIINGVPYKRALLASHALFPLKAGISNIDEYRIRASVQVPNGSFGSFGLGPTYSFTRASERAKITVKPLPTVNRPQNFSGAVGQFEVSAAIEGNKFTINQPFPLKVKFEGRGNAKLIELPPLQLPGGVELYDTKSDAKFFKDGKSYKEFELLIIPRQKGELTIPSISVSMFDPVKKAYYSKATQPVRLNIQDADESYLSSNRVQEKGSPASAVKKNELPDVIQAWNSSEGFSAAARGWSIGILYLVVLSLLSIKGVRELGSKEKQRDLTNEIKKRIRKVQNLTDKEDWRSAATEMTNVFSYTLGEVAGQGGGSHEISKLLELVPPSVRRELSDDIKKSLDYFQTLAFAPESIAKPLWNKKEMNKNIKVASELLAKAVALKEQQ